MAEPHHPDPAGRFSGLAELYARNRPSYPDEAIEAILSHCDLRPGCRVVDVGCGTGISSRLFALRFLDVVGIEPNGGMRAQAAREALPPGIPPPEYRDGRAEATGLADAFADAVVAAQAFHWFQPAAALQEFHRILKPGGWVVLLWNERDERDPFTAAYGEAVRSIPGAALIEADRALAGASLLSCPLFERAERRLFHGSQTLDLDGLLGRTFSASYAPRDPEQASALAAKLTELFRQFERMGHVEVRYETAVYLARRPRPSNV